MLSFPYPLRFLFATHPAVLTHIDIEHCGVCGGTVRVIACIETPELVDTILTHLAARNTACSDSPRGPPLRASGAELPVSPSSALS